MPIDLPPVDPTSLIGVTLADAQREERRISPLQHLDLPSLTVTFVSSRDRLNIDPVMEQDFNALADQWRSEIRHLSSDSDIAGRFVYQQIIGMGKPALPLILRELQQHGGRWFWALRAITRENPVRLEDRGNVTRMAEAWLEWGQRNRYVR